MRSMNFLEKYNILNSQQFGFIPNKTTDMAIFHIISYITEQLDKNNKVARLYFDLSKAFDTVDYLILLEVSVTYGIRGVAGGLIRSYLSGKLLRVFISYNGYNKYSRNFKVR